MFTLTSLPLPSDGTLSDSGGVIQSVPHTLPTSTVTFRPAPCCTYDTCTASQVQQQQHNIRGSFAYTTTDVYQRAPVRVLLDATCPLVNPPLPESTALQFKAVVALAVVGSIIGVACAVLFYLWRRRQLLDAMNAIRHENQAQIRAAENDAQMAAKEQEQLRSIMGNVAHDMKTPLHSIIAEIDFIRQSVPETEETRNSFESLDTTCKFLVMAINRSQVGWWLMASVVVVVVIALAWFDCILCPFCYVSLLLNLSLSPSPPPSTSPPLTVRITSRRHRTSP